MRPSFRILIPLALCTCSALTAQGDPPTVGLEIPLDPFSGMGYGFLLAGEDEIVRRFPNEQTLAPAPFQPSADPTRPLFRITGPGGVFGPNGNFAGALPGEIEFDAISTGNDLLPADGAGQIGFPPGQSGNPSGIPSWVNVAISVEGSAQGLNGSPLNLRFTTPTPVAADLYSYWFEHNVGTGPLFIDETYLSDGHEQLGVQPTDDVVGMDMFMQLLADAPPDGAIAQVDFELYFSITPASESWIRSIGRTRLLDPATPDSDLTAATIFKTVWANGAWGPVEVEFTPAELVNPTEQIPTDVDAIAFDARSQNGTGPNRALVFSETMASAPAGRSQLRILVRNNMGTTIFRGNATNTAGNDLRNRIGIRNVDDVDAICGKDPEFALSSYFAAPIEDHLMVPYRFGLKAEHVAAPRGFDTLAVQIHNLDGLRDQLPPGADQGTLQLHIWTVTTNDVTAPAGNGNDLWIENLGNLDDTIGNELSVVLPDPAPGSVSAVAIQAVYLPNGPAPQPFYVSWRLAMFL